MIQCRNLTKRYGTRAAVNELNLEIAQGEFCALLGPNGAGKTTFIRMLLGFCKPSSGALTIGGVSVSDIHSRQGIGYLAERHRIPAHLTGHEYLQRNAALAGIFGSEADKRIEQVLDICGMTGRDKENASGYSKGMGQRIGLAAALIRGNRLLILDEPVSGLDPLGIRDVRLILERLRADGVTILLSSHLLSEAEKVCSTVAVMKSGQLLIKDTVEAITATSKSVEDVFIEAVEGGKV
jgi:ABC-2 type transport system ATP-binding protein